MTPLVSIVIPTYNYGRYVVDAVDSALGQTCQDTEVIVVDDGSTDDTSTKLSAFRGRVRYVFQANRGLSAARNLGISKARGKWVAFLDADDLWHPEKLEVQLRAAGGDPDIGLIGGMVTTSDFAPLNHFPPLRRLTVRDFLLTAPMGPSSAVVRRDCISEVGLFDESLRSVEDRDMWLRLAARYLCVLVQAPCWWYRRHTGQMNRAADRMLANYHVVLTKFFQNYPEYAGFYRAAMSYMYFDTAWTAFEEGDRRKALIRLFRSFAHQPLGLKDKRRPRLIRTITAIRAIAGRIPCVEECRVPESQRVAIS